MKTHLEAPGAGSATLAKPAPAGLQEFLDGLAVGARVAHSDALTTHGTVESFDDPAGMGDVLVTWDSPLPWLASRVDQYTGEQDGGRAWHGLGFLRPVPETVPFPEECQAGRTVPAFRF